MQRIFLFIKPYLSPKDVPWDYWLMVVYSRKLCPAILPCMFDCFGPKLVLCFLLLCRIQILQLRGFWWSWRLNHLARFVSFEWCLVWSLDNQSSGWILMFSLDMVFSSPWHLKSILMQMLRQNCHYSIGLVPSNSPLRFSEFILFTRNATHSYYKWKLPSFECRAQKRMHRADWTYKSIHHLPFYVYYHGIHMVGFSVDEDLCFFQG